MRILSLLALLILSFPLLVFTQNEADEPSILILSVAGYSCGMEIVVSDSPEATPEPDDEPEVTYPIISLGDDCESVIPQLVVSRNGTLWIEIGRAHV